MKTKEEQKRCEFCKKHFIPNPKVGHRQRACSSVECQRKRKHQNQQRWIRKNPQYFKGRYPQLKEQILRYQAEKRALKQESAKMRGVGINDIQDELRANKKRVLQNVMQKLFTIQDELSQLLTDSNKKLQKDILKLYTSRVKHKKYKELIYSCYTRPDG